MHTGFSYNAGCACVIDVDVSAVIAHSHIHPFSEVYIIVDSDEANWVIREVEAATLTIHLDYAGSSVIDAILSCSAQCIDLSMSCDIPDIDRIFDRLTNLRSLDFIVDDPIGQTFPQTLPQTLRRLYISDRHVTIPLMERLSKLVHLESLTIYTDGPYCMPLEWPDLLMAAIGKMPSLTIFRAPLPSTIDPLPFLLAMPPTIQHISIYQNAEGYSIRKFVQTATHGYTELKTLYIGYGSYPVARILRALGRRLMYNAICELDGMIGADVISLIAEGMDTDLDARLINREIQLGHVSSHNAIFP